MEDARLDPSPNAGLLGGSETSAHAKEQTSLTGLLSHEQVVGKVDTYSISGGCGTCFGTF